MNIIVDIDAQRLSFTDNVGAEKHYTVSTATRGTGQQFGSEQTPLGKHYIRVKVGADAPERAVFVGRCFTGEIYTESLAQQFPQRDWILTRILWLSGREPGVNKNGPVDSLRRYIYIHGTPDTEPMGIPASHGCVRMRNTDLIELFKAVEKGTTVDIR